MALEHPQLMTVEEYLHLDETDTENRYEYIDGQVYSYSRSSGQFTRN